MRFELPPSAKLRFAGSGRSLIVATIVMIVLLVAVIGHQLDIPILTRPPARSAPPRIDEWPDDMKVVPDGLRYGFDMADALPAKSQQRIAEALQHAIDAEAMTEEAFWAMRPELAHEILFRLYSLTIEPPPTVMFDPAGWIAETEAVHRWARDVHEASSRIAATPLAADGRVIRDERLVLRDWDGAPVRQTELADPHGGVFTVIRAGGGVEPLMLNARVRVAGRFYGIRQVATARGNRFDAVILIGGDVRPARTQPVVALPKTDLLILAIFGAAMLSVFVILWAKFRDRQRPPVNWRALLRGADLNELEEEIEGKPPADYEFDVEIPDNLKSLIEEERAKQTPPQPPGEPEQRTE